jgi:ubiquinol-cytochrome c reductase iron-sulfur subunit
MSEPVRRRDWLATAAFGVAGVGGLLAMWPFVAALGPDADTMARRVTFNVSDLGRSPSATFGVGSVPVLIFIRTVAELTPLQRPPVERETRTGGGYRDRDSVVPMQPAWAANWHRSLTPEIMICVPACTHDSCIVRRPDTWDTDRIICPCCGSRYDLAGRVYAGPAKYNLIVPPHRYVDASTIEFNEAQVTQAMRALHAGPG